MKQHRERFESTLTELCGGAKNKCHVALMITTVLHGEVTIRRSISPSSEWRLWKQNEICLPIEKSEFEMLTNSKMAIAC